MARPRVFVSSTFYDLKQIRADLERFIKEMGYEPVLHERGAIPYGSKEKLEAYCYREINQVELLISIVGGRFGSQSEHHPYSVSQQELRTAYDLGIQVFIFVESAVLGEYHTYLRNKSVEGVKFGYVDDSRIYQFIEEVYALPNNNQITGFGSAQDIVGYLREQWAGMFQRFLQNQERQQEAQILKDLQANMQTLNQLVTYLSKEKQNSDGAIREILLSNHPIFAQMAKLVGVPVRMFFTNRTELTKWVKYARRFEPTKESEWERPEFEEWIRHEAGKPSKVLRVSTSVFDEDGALVIFTPQQWRSEWVSVIERQAVAVDEDDVPF